MQRSKAFTLIELLVVIAIIAILAAILFPVFAQAKAAAKKAGSLSNVKQLALGLQMYANDNEDVFAPANLPCVNPCSGANDADWKSKGEWWGETWVFFTQPYVKNYGIFQSPGDASKTGGGWDRPALSYSINAYVDGFWEGKHGATWTGGNWYMGQPSVSSIGRVADTVLIGERHHNDYGKKWAASYFKRNDGHGIQGNAPFAGVDWMDWWIGPAETPDGKANDQGEINDNWPHGKNGTVSAVWQGQANFAFVDGHARSMKPVATCPDKWGEQDKNMWDGSRK